MGFMGQSIEHPSCLKVDFSYIEEESTKTDFEEFYFVMIFQTINCALKHLTILNIPSYIFFC